MKEIFIDPDSDEAKKEVYRTHREEQEPPLKRHAQRRAQLGECSDSFMSGDRGTAV
jgi:hypothetical protein